MRWALVLGLGASCTQRGPPEPPAPSPAEAAGVAEEPPAAGPRTVLDFEAIEAWIACRKAGQEPAVCERASAETRWGRFAEQARRGFGPPRETMPEPPSLGQVETLVARMGAWDDPGTAVAMYFPEPMPVDLVVGVVGNGHGWGDMYTRPYEPDEAPAPGRRHSANVAIVNAVLVAAQYKGTVAEQAEGAFGVLQHETFHLLFHTYRRNAETWAAWPENPTPLQRLQFIALNEGIAHFVDARDELEAEGVPPERLEAVHDKFGDAVEVLARGDPSPAEIEELLRAANQGPYWDKYAAIFGMFMTHTVVATLGMGALREAIRCGPGRLLALYALAMTRAEQPLPPLHPELDAPLDTDLCPDSIPR